MSAGWLGCSTAGFVCLFMLESCLKWKVQMASLACLMMGIDCGWEVFILLCIAFPPLVSQTGLLILLSQHIIPGGQEQNLQGTSRASLWDLYLNVSLLLQPAGPRQSQVRSSLEGGETALTLDGKKGKNHYAKEYAYWDGIFGH